MFTKQEIIDRYKNRPASSKTLDEGESLSLAMIITGSALFSETQRSGEDITQHAMEVAMGAESKNKRIIGLLHDVVEARDWTLDDLREAGFSERIIRGVDGVTKRPGEKYFDFIERCSLSGEDAIVVKINDLKHNSDPTRYRHIKDTEKQITKAKVYNIALHYLVDIFKTRASEGLSDFNAPGRSIVEYLANRRGYRESPEMANRLLDEFSSRAERLPPWWELPAVEEYAITFNLPARDLNFP